MEDGVPIHGGKPRLPIIYHHALQRIHSKLLAEIRFLASATDAGATLPLEDRDDTVTYFHVFNTFPNALNNPGTNTSISFIHQ